jgi:site-specific DNA-cytosine methylase
MPRIASSNVRVCVAAYSRERVVAATASGCLAPARVLVLCCGGGGVSLAFQGFEGALVAAAVDTWDEAIAVYAANFDHPILDIGFLIVEPALLALRALGPFNVVQISAPCVDFSTFGKGVEEPAAQLTVTCTRIALALGAPCIIFENVPRVLLSEAWREATCLSDRGTFSWAGAVLDAQHCGVLQRRKRSFVLAVRGQDHASRNMVLTFAAALEGVAASPVRRARGVKDVVPNMGRTFFIHAHNSTDTCILPPSGIAPTLRKNCAYRPSSVGRKGALIHSYRARPTDNQQESIDSTTFLAPWQIGMIDGFPEGLDWPKNRHTVGRLVGNFVAPAAFCAVLEIAREVRALALRAAPQPQPSPAQLVATRAVAAGR